MSFLGMKRRYLVLVPIMVLLMIFSAIPVSGDGGFIPVANFNVYEPGQTAILCWNGHQERMYLSINIYADQPTEGVHFVPFPSLPKVSLGDFETFQRLDDVFDRRLDYYNWEHYADGTAGSGGNSAPDDSFNIHYNVKLGNHEITVIEIISPEDFKFQIEALMEKVGMEFENWPSGLEDVLVNYTKKGYKFFAVDRFQIGNVEASVEPLIYDFVTDELVFPLEISSILKGKTNLQLAVITAEEHPIDISNSEGILEKKGEGILEHGDVIEIDPWLDHLFKERCIGLLYEGWIDLEDLRGDFLIHTKPGISWSRAGEITIRYEPRDGLDASRILLYDNRITPDDDQLILIDELTGNKVWEKSPYPLDIVANDKNCYREVIFSDIDGDDNGDLVLLDHDHPNMIVTRLDPSNGAKLWQTKVNTINSIRGKICMRGNDNDAKIIMYTNSDLYAIDLEHGFNWSKNIGDDVLYHNEPVIFNSPNGQLIKIFDYTEKMTTIYSPWSGNIIPIWDTDMWGGEIVNFHRGDLVMFIDQGYYYFMNPLNGSVEFSYPTSEDYLFSCYYDQMTPRSLNGIFLSYGLDGLTVKKVSFSNNSISWSTTKGDETGVPQGFHQYQVYHIDTDNDGIMEVILSKPSNKEIYDPYTMGTKFNTMVFDGETGDLEFNSRGRLLGIKDKDTNGGIQLCMNEEELISVYNMRNWNPENIIKKRNTGSGEELVSFRDMNNDGFSDIITRTYISNPYSDRYPTYIGDTFINGYTQNCESFIDVDSYNAYRHGCVISGRAGKLLYREGYRLYSMSMESIMMLQTDSEEIKPGESAQFYIKVDDREVILSRDTIILHSEYEMGSFSEIKELLPGVFSFKWTAPITYRGPLTIAAKIVVDSRLICTSKIEILIVDDGPASPDLRPSDITVEISNVITTIGVPITVEIIVHDDFDPIFMDIKLHDLDLCAIINQPIQISTGRYIGTFTPVRNAEVASLLLEIIFDDKLIERRLWNINVLEMGESEDIIEMKVGVLQAFPQTVDCGDPVLLFLPISFDGNINEVRIVCEDEGKEGHFMGLRTPIDSLILVDYYTPSVPGIVNISVDVYMGARYISTGFIMISVIDNEGSEVSTPDDLEISHTMKTTPINNSWKTDLFINVSRFGSHLDVVNYIQLSQIENMVVAQGAEMDGSTLHLIIEHDGSINEEVRFLIWDEYGTSDTLEIKLEIDGSGEQDLTGDDGVGSVDANDQNGSSIIFYFILIAVLCTTLIVTALGFTMYEIKRKNIRTRPEEPAPIKKGPRSKIY